MLHCVQRRGKPLTQLKCSSKHITIIMIWQTIKLHSQPIGQTRKFYDCSLFSNKSKWEQLYKWLNLMEATLSFSTHLPFLLLDQAHAIIIAQTVHSSNDCDEMCWWVLLNKTQWCVDKWKSSLQTGELIIGKMSLAERPQVGLFITRPITDTNHGRLSSLIPGKTRRGLWDPSAAEKQQLMFYDRLPKHICS